MLSNLVSNVPAVLLFKPVIPAMPAGVQETAWLALAMSSTLAGNLTVLGSVANLIVVENARQEGVAITLRRLLPRRRAGHAARRWSSVGRGCGSSRTEGTAGNEKASHNSRS